MDQKSRIIVSGGVSTEGDSKVATAKQSNHFRVDRHKNTLDIRCICSNHFRVDRHKNTLDIRCICNEKVEEGRR